MALSFDELLEEARTEAKEKGLDFTAKGGVAVLFRPVLSLNKQEMKVVLTLVESMQDEKLSVDAKLEAIDTVLIAVADKKDATKKSLADLPLTARIRIFEEWTKAADLPEA